MYISQFKAAEIRLRLGESKNLMAIVPDPTGRLYLYQVYGIPKDRIGVLFSIDSNSVLIMRRRDYERLKRKESRVLGIGK
jgi:hypothetical protein